MKNLFVLFRLFIALGNIIGAILTCYYLSSSVITDPIVFFGLFATAMITIFISIVLSYAVYCDVIIYLKTRVEVEKFQKRINAIQAMETDLVYNEIMHELNHSEENPIYSGYNGVH